MNKRPQDSYGHKARREGYPARSVYKLEEIDKRVRLFKPGQRVLDLGAYPGSWTMYAAERVGEKGSALGVDIQEHRGGLLPNVEMRVVDILKADESTFAADGPFDVVISDMAPATTGTRSLDQYRSFELYARALEIAGWVLRPGGSFVGKIFQGGEFEEARNLTRELFDEVRIVKPKASRQESYETFFVGLKKKKSSKTAPQKP